MFQNVARLASITRSRYSAGKCLYGFRGAGLMPTSFARFLADDAKDNEESKMSFDDSLLEFLVCPLSKKALRYEKKTNELINEELGIAYPIIDGIPNMIPQEARMINKNPGEATPTQA